MIYKPGIFWHFVFLCPVVAMADDPKERPRSNAEIEFSRHIAPILAAHCLECHGPDAQKRQAGLRLDTRKGALARLESGGFAIVPGNVGQSHLIKRVTSHDDDFRMPPDSKKRLSPRQINLLSRWIEQGAKFSRHWAFVAPRRQALPSVKNKTWARNAIDRFILARLENAGLKPAPQADKRTLIRRAYFDLIGLPPTPDEIKEFLKNDSPNAFAELIERLLASPHYGERWGRHWLDVARYGDSSGGDENHFYPLAFRYRNYVIDAMNGDVPYDQFVQEQIAGDLLSDNGVRRDLDRVTATGFLALGMRILNEQDPLKKRADIVDEQIDTLGRAILGLTLGCARCHDHKFDPVSNSDYYALAGIFHSTDLKDRTLKQAAPKTHKVMAVADGRIRNVKIHIRGSHLSLGKEVPRNFLQVMADRQAQSIPADQSGRLQLASWLTRPDSAAGGLVSRVMVNRIWHWHFGRGIVGTPDNFGVKGHRPTHPLLLDYLARRFIRDGWSIKSMHRLIMLSSTYQMASQNPATDPAKARSGFYENQVDSENRLYWRFKRRRLEAEEIRDALLIHAGRLDRSVGGARPIIKSQDSELYDVVKYRKLYETFRRRSVYLPVVRTNVYKFLTLLDFPNACRPVGERDATTVPTQALMMMNSPFVIRQSESLAKSILADERLDNDSARIRQLYWRLLSRPPAEVETRWTRQFLEKYEQLLKGEADDGIRRWTAWTALCQTLISSNDFFYMN
jgi:hypothetical protein